MSKIRFLTLVMRAYARVMFKGVRKDACSSSARDAARILVVPQTNRIGDLVCATPTFRAIKDRYPHSFLGVLVSKSKKSWEIIKHNPHIDAIFFYEDTDILPQLTKHNFDWCFNLTNYPVPSVLAFLARIPCRVKTVLQERSRSEVLTDWFNTHTVLYKHHTYVPHHYLSLLSHINIIDAPEIKEVFPNERDDAEVEKFLTKHGLEGRFLIGMSITAGNTVKEWPPERFVEFIDRVLKEYDATIVLIGAPREQDRLDSVRSMVAQQDRVVIANTFSVSALPSLLQSFQVMVGVDTGTIYVANALGVPVVDITGPCDPREQPPQDNLSQLVLPPSPEYYSSFVFKRPGSVKERRRAAKSISVDQVYNALIAFLRRLNRLPRRL